MSIILNGNGTSNFSSNIANDGTVAFGTSAFNLDSSGNVGIGLTNPSGMIEVQKSGVPAIISNYANQKHIQMGSGGSGAGFHVTDGNFFTINHQPYTDRGTDNNLTERFRVTTDGNVNITDGNLVVASGHGIDFSATADGSGTMTSEVLDDYEEGTWEPYLSGTSGGSVTSFSERYGIYTRIGEVVIVQFYITNPGSNSGVTGDWRIDGLPFGAKNYGNYYSSGTISYIRGLSSNGWLGISVIQDSATRTHAQLWNNPTTTGETQSVSGSVPSNLMLRGNIIYTAV